MGQLFGFFGGARTADSASYETSGQTVKAAFSAVRDSHGRGARPALLWLSSAPAKAAAIAYVQVTAQVAGSPVASQALTFSQPVAAGDLLVSGSRNTTHRARSPSRTT